MRRDRRKPFLAEGTASVAGGSTVNMSNGRTRRRGGSKRKVNNVDRALGPVIKARGKEWGEFREYGKKREKLTLIACKLHSLG